MDDKDYELKKGEKSIDDKPMTEKELNSYDKAIFEGRKLLKKFEKAYTAVGTRQDELREAIAFYEGDQHLLSQWSDNTPWVIQMKTPHAKLSIDNRVSSITASDYVGELFPLAVEDVETIQALNDLVADEWDRLNLNQKIDSAIKSGAFMREGYIHFYFDDSQSYGGTRSGTIECAEIDSTSLFIDPNARKWSDAQYIVVTGRIPTRVAKSKYGRVAEYIKPTQGGVTEYERGEVSISNDYQIEQDDYFTILTFYEKVGGKIQKSVVIEDVLVSKDILDGLTCMPIAQFKWGVKKQSPYGISLMDDLITSQKALNAIESAITNTALASASPAVVIQKGQGLNPKDVADTIGAPSVVYAVNGDPTKAIVPLNTQSINGAVVQIKADLERSLKESAGLSEAFVGSLGTSGNTSGGSQMAIERAKVIEGEVLKNVEEFVEQITEILVEYITSQYAGDTVTSLKKDETTQEYQTNGYMIPKNAKDTDYRFYVNLSTRTPYSKEREKDALFELWQMERQYDAPTKLLTVLDILNKYNLTNKDELVDRYKRMSAQSAQSKTEIIMQMTQTAMQYQVDPQVLQAAIQEVISDAKETPATEAFMKMAEQAAQQQQQMQVQQQQQAQQAAQQEQQMMGDVAKEAATQIVDSMPQEDVMAMAQQQSLPAELTQMLGGMMPQ